MKIALCCIGKNENPYIREFVENYKTLGFTNIILYDNNVDNGENFEDVISDYIDEGFVILKNYRNKKNCQEDCYKECYHEYKNDYDWICFFDCDEFLTLSNFNSIEDFLSSEKFNNCQMIHVHWMCYGDCDKLHYEDKPLSGRFNRQITPINFNVAYSFPENCHIKSIIRGGLEVEPSWTWQPHTPVDKNLICCQVDGTFCTPDCPFAPMVFNGVYLKHYTTKTIEEWCKKIERGFPDHQISERERIDMVNKFFRYNKVTNSKIKIIEELTGIKIDKNNIRNFVNMEAKIW